MRHFELKNYLKTQATLQKMDLVLNWSMIVICRMTRKFTGGYSHASLAFTFFNEP